MDNKSSYPPTEPGYQPGDPPIEKQPGYQEPPPNFNQTTGGISAEVHVTPAMIPPFGPTPSQRQCPSCNATILTNIIYEPNTRTHLMAFILFCFVCWPCVCLPYCMDSCQSAKHYCPNCNAYLGAYDSGSC